jgi:hypothetical protein
MAKSKWDTVKDKLILVEGWARDGLTEDQVINILNEKQRYYFTGKEKEYEKYIKENIIDICKNIGLPKVLSVKSQQRFDIDSFSIKPDIMIYHENNSLSVFEVKCCNYKYPSTGVSEQTKAIGQLLLYKNVLEELRRDKVRVFLIDQKIYKRTVCIFANMKLPITLIEVQNDRVFIPYKNI